jgi:hypothetical protein
MAVVGHEDDAVAPTGKGVHVSLAGALKLMVVCRGWEPIGAIRDLEGMVFGWFQRE